MALYAGVLGAQLMHLAGHVIRVDKSKALARGGDPILLLEIGEVWIGRGFGRWRHIDAAVHGGPAAINQVLLEMGSCRDAGEFEDGDIDLVPAPC